MPRTHSQGAHRGLDAAANGEFGRFGRMFAGLEGPEFDEDALEKVANAMLKDDPGQTFNLTDEDENPTISAGYTYFGQFVDHDLTLDKTSMGEAEADPDAIANFRSPALDLDSVYGNGPWGDVVLYDEDFKLQVSTSRIAQPAATGFVQTQFDHRRASDGTALIGDPRNDENVIVAQLHQAFVMFHNKIMDTNSLMGGIPAGERSERFRRARRLAVWHYQWVVIHDFLKKICQPEIYDDIVNPGGAPRLRLYNDPGPLYAYMPIEFAGAAYRFGHSMVRPSYALNKKVGTDQATKRIPIFKDKALPGEDLRGFAPIHADYGIDWGYFFNSIPGDAPATQLGTGTAQNAYRIDSILVDPLGKLVNPDIPKQPARGRNLAFRNLLRGSRLRLPTAEQVAIELGMKGFPAARFPFLSPEQIWSAGSRHAPTGQTNNPTIEDFRDRRKGFEITFAGATPLWYYILREADWYGAPKAKAGKPNDILGGHHLGPIGSIIVLETFLGILMKDEGSILHQAGWRPRSPIAGSSPNKFDLPALLKWALT